MATPTPGTPSLLRAINDRAALEMLLEHGSLTRPRLGELTGLSKPTASQLLARLEQAGLVVRDGVKEGTTGRTAEMYRIDANAAHVAGLDVSPVRIRVAVADLAGTVLGEHTLRTPGRSGAGVVSRVRTAVEAAARAAGIRPGALNRVVIGIQGAVDPGTGRLGYAAHIPGWHVPGITARMAEGLGLRVAIENDVNLAALAELDRGEATGSRDFVLLWSGDGIGMAVVLGGALHRGATGGAGEIGYMPLAGAPLVREVRRTRTGGLQVAQDHRHPDAVRRRTGVRTSLRRIAMAAAIAGPALTAACTAGGSPAPGDGPKADAAQTIEVWHGWSADHEVKAFEDAVAGFRRTHPNITVKLVGDQTDDRITNTIRGGNPPDVVSSFTTDSVGQWCQSGAWQDLSPYIRTSRLDLGLFPKAVQEYTQYKGRRCAMPLLADTYGLYYNKALMKGHQPPRTISELTDLAKRLTVRDADGTIKVAGFMPSVQYYEHVPQHIAPQFGVKWLTDDGRAGFASDPAFKAYLRWQKGLVDWYGYDNVRRFLRSMGQEFEASNPFQKGKVAMAVDGEWRTKFLQEQAPELDYGTAPPPVADDLRAGYGGAFVAGTVIGVPRGARHPQAAWEFIRYLTTDTDALVTFANALGNVPSTIPALSSPKLTLPPQFHTFLDVFKHPSSSTTPPTANGNDYVVKSQQFIQDQWEPGKVPDLDRGLRDLDAKIDKALRLAGG